MCSTKKIIENLPINIRRQIGDIIYELFKNTHEHARSDISGDRIDNALRGIAASLHAKTGLHHLRLAEKKKNSPVKEYLAGFELRNL